MKTDEPGFLDVKLTVIAVHPEAWIAGLAELGSLEHEEETGGWVHKRVKTSAAIGGRTIRLSGYVGSPQASMQVAMVGADRVITDGATEIPDFTLANPTRFVGPPGKESWLAALKEVLKEAASQSH